MGYEKLVIILLLSGSTQFNLVLGMNTTICNNDQIQDKLMKSLDCWKDTLSDEVELIVNSLTTWKDGIKLNTSVDCDVIEKLVSCFTDNIGQCIEAEKKTEAITLLDYGIRVANFTNCQRITGAETNQTKYDAIITKNYEDEIPTEQEIMEYLRPMVTLDRNCSLEQLRTSFEEKQMCLSKSFAFKQIIEGKSDENDELGFESIRSLSKSVCRTIDDVLFCLPTKCLSEGEVGLIKMWIITFYDIIMDHMATIVEKYGDIGKVIAKAAAGEMLDSNAREEIKNTYGSVMKDYKVKLIFKYSK